MGPENLGKEEVKKNARNTKAEHWTNWDEEVDSTERNKT